MDDKDKVELAKALIMGAIRNVRDFGGKCIWCEQKTYEPLLIAMENGDSTGPFYVVPQCLKCKATHDDVDVSDLMRRIQKRLDSDEDFSVQ